jgi:pyridoxine 5-phosphate synthase
MRLYVNIDHVATVRQARRTDEPDPVRAAVLAELGGAEGITVHLREDRRHIQDRDVRLLLETCRTPLNLEIAAEEEGVRIARDLAPVQVTLVPERREEVTTEGGLNLEDGRVEERVAGAVEILADAGIRVSLFIDPTESAIRIASRVGAAAVELHTGEYSNARSDATRASRLADLRESALEGVRQGLAVHAGHGLTYENVIPVAAIPEIEEVNIGHSIVSRAVLVGMERAVAEMRALLREAPSRVKEPGSWQPPIGF